MQAAPKQPKKPSFKCPAFSVPAKPKTDKPATKNTAGKAPKKREQKQVKLIVNSPVAEDSLHNQLTSDGDNTNNSVEQKHEQPKPDGDNKLLFIKELKLGGDDKRNELEVIQHEHEDTPVTGDYVENTSPEDNGGALKKKKKTDFKVKTAAEDGEKGVVKKKRDKLKKKKDVGDEGDKMLMPKQKKVKETKKTKEKKDGTGDKPKMTLPIRSLTDEEYIAIFEAAIENAMNLNIEEWQPKPTPPVKVKEPVRKKYSVTVGRKVSETSDKKLSQELQEPCTGQSKETEEKLPEVLGEAGDEDNQQEENQEQIADDEVQVDENNNIGEEREVDVHNDVEEIEVDVLENGPIQESAQKENETTPAGSEVDTGEKQPDCVNTPVKRKKLPKVTKKPKLEPKQLPFERKSEASMVDKIQQMKKMKKGKHDVNLKKRKLNEDTKIAEKMQRKDSHKDSLKEKTRQKLPQKKTNKRKKMQQRELQLNGTWVQCCNSTCMKWRYLPDVSDPTLIPERWTCKMNPNEDYNSCDKAEESYDETEHIYTKFAEGSVVWARMTGYPWWPAMVEIDPNEETYFSADSCDSMIPTHYHVVFFDEHVSRAWVKTEGIKAFTGSEEDDGILYQTAKKGASYTKGISAAKKNAMRALQCSIKERIELFGFAARYKGPWGSKCKDKPESTKPTPARRSAEVEEECLDDSTMDDVLDNTEALLDNVEEMLDSLDSQLMDSDADSDFVPIELNVVEKKRKKAEVSTSRKEIQGMKDMKYGEVDSESDIDILENSDKFRKNKHEADKNKSPSKIAVSKLNLDSDIFTMEMDSQDDNVTAGNKTDKIGGDNVPAKPDKRNTTKETKKEFEAPVTKEKELQTPVSTNKEEHTKMRKEKKGPRLEAGKEDKKVEQQEKPLSGSDSETTKLMKSVNQNAVAKEKELDENRLKVGEASNKKVVHSIKELNVDTERDKIEIDSCEAEIKDEVCTKDCVREGPDCYDPDPESDYDTGTDAAGDKRRKELENGDIGDLIDLGDIEVDVGSNNIDENNMMVPDLDKASSATEPERNPGQSLEGQSDDEFDLEEHFMYETNTDGSDKVRERALLVEQGIHDVEEDSDPFDLMEV